MPLNAFDTASSRKARGAFFTPPPIAKFIVDWAIRDEHDRVLEPSTGDAEFLIPAVSRLRQLSDSAQCPEVFGVEIHEHSARVGAARVDAAGGLSRIVTADFFDYSTDLRFDAVIGNPPFVRFQDFSAESRAKAREAALRSGVSLSRLASSWAAFVVHSTSFLRVGGRLGFVLPAELLSVDYASPVRRFIFDNFAEVNIVLFEEQVFPDAEADVVLLTADGFKSGRSDFARVVQTRNSETLAANSAPWDWRPTDRGGKWTSLLLPSAVRDALGVVSETSGVGTLGDWGSTSLGMVTGANNFFTLSDSRVSEMGLKASEVLPLSPPGSAHLRGLGFSRRAWATMGAKGAARWLFRPDAEGLSAGAREHIAAGEKSGVSLAYKCRVRDPWWRVPLVRPADLFVTYMNAEAPRISANEANVLHLNSVHGFYLKSEVKDLGIRHLPLLSLSSLTLFSSEIEGRAYGGGMLKLEPREARSLALPHVDVVSAIADDLDSIRGRVSSRLRKGQIGAASRLVDDVVLAGGLGLSSDDVSALQSAREYLWDRRRTRSASRPVQ